MSRTSIIAIIAAVLGALGVVWHLTADRPARPWMYRPALPPTTGTPAPQASPTGAGLSFPHADIHGPDVVKLRAAPSARSSGTTAASDGRTAAALGMTRVLSGTNRVTLDGRDRSVLGTRLITNAAGQPETLLLVRDEVSGQVSYHQSGLHFALKDGADYEAFIRDHARTQRLFVNLLYAQVAVDAADIAAVYNDMARDPRLASLRFLDREPVRTLK